MSNVPKTYLKLLKTLSLLISLFSLLDTSAQFNTIGPRNGSPNAFFFDTKEILVDSLKRDSVSRMIAEKKVEYNLGMLPLEKIFVTSFYGDRYHPIKKVTAFHGGVDLRAKDKNVLAVQSGIITDVSYNGELGQHIRLRCGTFEFVYGHLAHIYVTKGANIGIGYIIGRTGGTGSVTAKHLHFGIFNDGKSVDPYPILGLIHENLDFINGAPGDDFNVK